MIVVQFIVMLSVATAFMWLTLVYTRWRRKKLWAGRTHTSFELSFWRLAAPYLAFSLLGCLYGFWRFGSKVTEGQGLAVFVLLIFFLVSSMLVCARFLALIAAVDIGPDGVVCSNLWGSYHFLGWSEVTDVKRIHLGLVSFIRVYGGAEMSPLWIWDCLDDRAGFEAQLSRWLGADHPLRKYVGSLELGDDQ